MSRLVASIVVIAALALIVGGVRLAVAGRRLQGGLMIVAALVILCESGDPDDAGAGPMTSATDTGTDKPDGRYRRRSTASSCRSAGRPDRQRDRRPGAALRPVRRDSRGRAGDRPARPGAHRRQHADQPAVTALVRAASDRLLPDGDRNSRRGQRPRAELAEASPPAPIAPAPAGLPPAPSLASRRPRRAAGCSAGWWRRSRPIRTSEH